MPQRRLSIRTIAAVTGRLLALALVLAMAVLNVVDPPVLTRVRDVGADFFQRLAPRGDEGLPAPIVAIDEASLRRYGQWPWPRTLLARLVRRIADGHPRVLGVDIVFAEPDRMSPASLAASLPDLPPSEASVLAALPSNDTALAAAFRLVPTVLGLEVSFEPEPAVPHLRVPLVQQQGGDPIGFLPQFPYLLASLPELTMAQAGAAVLASAADPDGTVRCVPLFVVAQAHLLPGLAPEMLRVAGGQGGFGIAAEADGIRAVSVAGIAMPTDAQGRACLHFSPSYAGRYISAADLLDGTADPAEFAGKAVLLGLTGAGLLDLKQTPLGPVQGVEIHAQVIESALAGSLLRPLPRGRLIATAILVLAGLIPIFALPHRRAALALLLFAGEILLLGGGAFALFRFGNWQVDAVLPILAALLSFGAMQGASLRAAEATRRSLALELLRERESKARLEGELYVAKAIQMGLLPHQFPGAPARPDIEMYALLEPARMVGGDLYDFLFLDMRRLFFVVADVSGKGVPAALFMAMSKEVLRAATVQHGDALDLVFDEANAKISSASNDMLAEGADMMFVTVFAGVLDTVTGLLVYTCAGHDAPLLLRDLTHVVEIDGPGGPPLGALDQFPYPIERRQLLPGDTMILFTDGVTEAENPARDLYGASRFRRTVLAAGTEHPRGIIEYVREDLRRFVAGAEQADDITLFAIRWLGPQSVQPVSAP